MKCQTVFLFLFFLKKKEKKKELYQLHMLKVNKQ